MSDNAHDLLYQTILTIDRQLGKSYAKEHPQLLQSVMETELRLREQSVCSHCQQVIQEVGENGE